MKGASYHVMSRGNRKGKIFLSEADRLHFLEILDLAHRRYHVLWRATVLMNTHYHLLAETPHGNLSEVMKLVNGCYTQDWNRRHRRTGHVFEGRFVSVLIESSHYLRNVYRYIARNPVEAGCVSDPRAWPWSSHNALAGFTPKPAFLTVAGLDGAFGGTTLAEAQRSYREFVEADRPGPIHYRGNQNVVGSDSFQSNVRELIGDSMYQIRVPRSYRALARPELGALFAGLRSDLELRDQMIVRAQVVHGYTQAEIARSLAMHPNTVSKIVRRLKGQRYFLVRVK